jgi:hypothetical protein
MVAAEMLNLESEKEQTSNYEPNPPPPYKGTLPAAADVGGHNEPTLAAYPAAADVGGHSKPTLAV